MVDNALKFAVELHNNRLTSDEAEKVEVEREKLAFSLVSRVCRYVNEYLVFSKSTRFSQLEFEESNGYSPDRYLVGVLTDMYSRSMAGHGSEAKAVNILLSGGVILDQSFVRTGDFYIGVTDLNTKREDNVDIKEDGIHVTFVNFPFYPKSPKYSPEPPGYYKVEILLSREESQAGLVRKIAEDRYKELEIFEKKTTHF